MNDFYQAALTARYNFLMWKRNPRIIIGFAFSFIFCFLLSDKVVRFAEAHNTSLQCCEPFIWSFGDSGSILIASLLLIFLLADMPYISNGTPFFLVRTNRRIWISGQLLYTLAVIFLYLLFTYIATCLCSAQQSYAADIWSPTAAILGYTDAGKSIAVPALVKTLEMSLPFSCTAVIIFLMLAYLTVLALLMLNLNLRYGFAAGVAGAFLFTLYGFLLKPATIAAILDLPDELYYRANVIAGWLSPLNHATYHMHNFGYDKLPRIGQSFVIFGILIIVEALLAVRAAGKYSFPFVGTEG